MVESNRYLGANKAMSASKSTFTRYLLSTVALVRVEFVAALSEASVADQTVGNLPQPLHWSSNRKSGTIPSWRTGNRFRSCVHVFTSSFFATPRSRQTWQRSLSNSKFSGASNSRIWSMHGAATGFGASSLRSPSRLLKPPGDAPAFQVETRAIQQPLHSVSRFVRLD